MPRRRGSVRAADGRAPGVWPAARRASSACSCRPRMPSGRRRAGGRARAATHGRRHASVPLSDANDPARPAWASCSRCFSALSPCSSERSAARRLTRATTPWRGQPATSRITSAIRPHHTQAFIVPPPARSRGFRARRRAARSRATGRRGRTGTTPESPRRRRSAPAGCRTGRTRAPAASVMAWRCSQLRKSRVLARSRLTPMIVSPRGPSRSCRRLRRGRSSRQGAHHVAQKSTSTTRPLQRVAGPGAAVDVGGAPGHGMVRGRRSAWHVGRRLVCGRPIRTARPGPARWRHERGRCWSSAHPHGDEDGARRARPIHVGRVPQRAPGRGRRWYASVRLRTATVSVSGTAPSYRRRANDRSTCTNEGVCSRRSSGMAPA